MAPGQYWTEICTGVEMYTVWRLEWNNFFSGGEVHFQKSCRNDYKKLIHVFEDLQEMKGCGPVG